MKMVVEWFIMMFVSILFFSFGLFYMNVVFVHQDALQLEEYAIMLIEHHNGYDEQIASKINDKCNEKMDVRVEADDNGESIAYMVYVTYKVRMPFSKKLLTNTLYSMTET